jgi:phosphotransferase system HPr (HPr) family protein
MRLVETCERFACDIRLSKTSQPDWVFDGKSIMQVSALVGTFGDTLVVETEGADAKSAIAAIREFFDRLNGEGLDYIRELTEDKE